MSRGQSDIPGAIPAAVTAEMLFREPQQRCCSENHSKDAVQRATTEMLCREPQHEELVRESSTAPKLFRVTNRQAIVPFFPSCVLRLDVNTFVSYDRNYHILLVYKVRVKSQSSS